MPDDTVYFGPCATCWQFHGSWEPCPAPTRMQILSRLARDLAYAAAIGARRADVQLSTEALAALGDDRPAVSYEAVPAKRAEPATVDAVPMPPSAEQSAVPTPSEGRS